MMRLPRVAMAVALLATGCSASGGLLPSRSPDPGELAEIKSRILELQRAAAMTRVEIDRLRQQLAALEAGLQAGGMPPQASAPPSPPAVAPVPPAPRQPVIEVSDIPQRPAAVAGPPASVPAAAPSPAAPAAPEPVGEAAQALYDRGYTLYHQGRYVDAEAGFRRFLQAHPNTSLSDNAQYWIGESRFARGDYEGALAAFQEAVQRYPGGNKQADSLLKAADCMQRLGDREAARAGYGEVMRRFPGTAAAAVAEERLDQMPP